MAHVAGTTTLPVLDRLNTLQHPQLRCLEK